MKLILKKIVILSFILFVFLNLTGCKNCKTPDNVNPGTNPEDHPTDNIDPGTNPEDKPLDNVDPDINVEEKIENVTIETTEYQINTKNKTAVIIKYSGNEEDIIIPSKIEYEMEEYDVIEIGERAFYWCRSIKKITIPSSVKIIGNSAFNGCSGISEINFSYGLEVIGESAFYSLPNVSELFIPASVKEIKWLAFQNTGDVAIYCEHPFEPKEWNHYWRESNNQTYWGVNENTFVKTENLSIVLDTENKTATIAKYFGDVEKIEIPSTVSHMENLYTVTRIGQSAFVKCKNLKELIIPNTVTSIEGYAINQCNQLASITIPFIGDKLDNPEKPFFEHIFGFVPLSLRKVIITGGTEIYENSFEECNSIKEIFIPKTVTTIGQNAFIDCSNLVIYCERLSRPLTWVTNWNYKRPVYWGVNEDNCVSIQDITYILDNETQTAKITRYRGAAETVEIADSITHNDIVYTVTSIGNNAFDKCPSSNIILPNSIIKIGKNAFYGCGEMISISIPSGVTTIESATFAHCFELRFIEIPNTVTKIDSSAFAYCFYLKEITIPNSVTSIGEYAFANCRNLTTINIPNSVISIKNCAFKECTDLRFIIIPDSVIEMGAFVFDDCLYTKIYCQAKEQPSNWHPDWNSYGNFDITWGYEE